MLKSIIFIYIQQIISKRKTLFTSLMSQIKQELSQSPLSLSSRQKDPQEQKNFGKWAQQEQKKYIAFLQFFKDDLKIRQKRKFFKIFKYMGEFIQTRTGIQCRSHHMKQLRSHKKLKNIVAHHKRAYNQASLAQLEEYYEEIKQKFSGEGVEVEPPKEKKGVQKEYVNQNEESGLIKKDDLNQRMRNQSADGNSQGRQLMNPEFIFMANFDLSNQNLLFFPYIIFRL